MPDIADFSDIQVGSNPVNEVYVGSTLVWERGGGDVIPFTMTQDTTIGFGSKQGLYQCINVDTTIDIDWGDGNTDTGLLSGTHIHDYGVDDIYTIKVTGINSPYFNNHTLGGQILTIDMGNEIILTSKSFWIVENVHTFIGWDGYVHPNNDSLLSCFEGCDALTNFTGENWDLSNATSFTKFFKGVAVGTLDFSTWIFPSVAVSYDSFLASITELTSISYPQIYSNQCSATFQSNGIPNNDATNWTLATGTSVNLMYNGAAATTIILPTFEGPSSNYSAMFNGAASVTTITGINSLTFSNSNLSQMLYFTTSYTRPNIATWDVTSVSALNLFSHGVKWDDDIYEDILESWSGQAVNTGLTPSFGFSRATTIARPFRDILTDTYSWNITDETTILSIEDVQANKIILSWIGASGTFDVFYTETASINWQIHGSTSSTSYTVDNLTGNVEYSFKINGNDGYGDSNIVTGTVEELLLESVNVAPTNISLAWNETGVGYEYDVEQLNGSWSKIATGIIDGVYDVEGLDSLTEYSFRVTKDDINYSNTVTETTTDPDAMIIITWIGNSTDDWDVPNNWNLGRIPQLEDGVYITNEHLGDVAMDVDTSNNMSSEFSALWVKPIGLQNIRITDGDNVTLDCNSGSTEKVDGVNAFWNKTANSTIHTFSTSVSNWYQDEANTIALGHLPAGGTEWCYFNNNTTSTNRGYAFDTSLTQDRWFGFASFRWIFSGGTEFKVNWPT